ncbi:MAG TPA: methyltransferase domain-containing protein [Puia sp.]
MSLDPQFWNDLYHHNLTAWDMGRVSPPLEAYFSQLRDKTLSILIPGCGNSYEAAWLVEQGHTAITLIDISDLLTSRLRAQFTIPIITGDFFQHTGSYDLIVEQTFFCALQPHLRPQYVEHMHSLLRPGGKLIGLLFDRDFPDDGPPFGGHEPEYRKLLENRFALKTLAPCYNSIKPRAGSELFFIAQKQVSIPE